MALLTKRTAVVAMALLLSFSVAATAEAQNGGGGGHGYGGGGDGRMGGHAGFSQHGGGSFHGGNDGFGRFNNRGGFDHRGGRPFGGPFVHVRVVRPFGGPFFAFRPRFNLGFGLFVGYPVWYPWDYVVPYAYDDPYAVAPYGSTYSQPENGNGEPSALSNEQRNYGGISLNITPGDAKVTVDGINAGTAQTFSPSSAPLALVPGQHHIVIEKPGYQSMTFDASVTQGQVIPYEGTMQHL